MPLGSSGWPTASSRCWIAESTAAARLWCCWSFAVPAFDVAPAPPAVTDIRQDLARFDRLFGLPAARLQVVNTLARSPSPWLAGVEEVEDTEIVHAVAPQAGIREILLRDSAAMSPAAWITGITAALRLGITQGAVISASLGSGGEHCYTPAEIAGLNATLQAASDRHVTVVNSSGDSGAASRPCLGATAGSAPVKEVNLLAADPLTLAASGTSLRASHATGAYLANNRSSRLARTSRGVADLGVIPSLQHRTMSAGQSIMMRLRFRMPDAN
jgi:hypothetical protein